MTGLPFEDIMHKSTALIYERNPWLHDRYGAKGIERTDEDNLHHLNHLATARELGNPVFFRDYAVWLAGLLQSHGMTADLLKENFIILKKILSDEKYSVYPETPDYCSLLDEGIAALQENMVEKELAHGKRQDP